MTVPRLNRKMTLEARLVTPDGSGGFVKSWQGRGEHWVSLLPGTGREGGAEGVTLSQGAFRIVLRASPVDAPSRPRPGERFREGARVFAIVSVTERDVDGRYLLCVAREEVPA